MNGAEAKQEQKGDRHFAFGKNWSIFLNDLNDEKIREAEKSLQDWLGVADLKGKSFLDIGSGSGLFSLAARNLGARVRSFDYDEDSVACTAYLREKYYPGDSDWQVERGDVLDEGYLKKYEPADVLYSWGVLHHTGDMYTAFAHVDALVKRGGLLYIAIYNDQGRKSRGWLKIKRRYNKCPKGLRFLILAPSFLRLWGPAFFYDLFRGKPFATWRDYAQNRGMSPWRDVVDWVGGYPFEVAKPEEVFDFFRARGYELRRLYTEGKGHGCNQFVFEKRV